MPGNGAAGASYGDLLVTSLVVLVGVCVAAFVVVRLVGRLVAAGRSRSSGHLMSVVERLPLEPRRSLYVVEVAGKALLVGTSEMGIAVLSELDRSVVGAREVGRQSFGELVRAAWLRRRAWGARGVTERPEVVVFDGEERERRGANDAELPMAARDRAEPVIADGGTGEAALEAEQRVREAR